MKKRFETIPQVGLVGISGYGRIHLGLIQKARQEGLVQFAAAVVINPEEEAVILEELREQGVRIYQSFDGFIAAERGQLDLCFIPTGIHLHAPMTVAALQAGMNVLVEKPLAGSVGQADWIIHTEKLSGRFVAVGFQDMYLNETVRLKTRLLEGAIGDLKSIRFMGLWPRPKSYYSRNHWTGKLFADGIQALDSPMNNGFAHFINLALYLAGAEAEGMAVAEVLDAELYRAHEIESFDTGVIRAQTREGIQLWFGASHACEIQKEPILLIEGTEGQVQWYFADRCIIQRAGKKPEEWALPDAEWARWKMAETVIRKLADPAARVSTAIASRALTALIAAAHDLSTIKQIHPSGIDRVPADTGIKDDYIPAIRGLPEALEQAFAQGSTLNDFVKQSSEE